MLEASILRGERVIRIELTYQAWEARVLPLNYTRNVAETLRIVPGGGGLSKRECQDHSIRFFWPCSGWVMVWLRSSRVMPLASTRAVTQPVGRSLAKG